MTKREELERMIRQISVETLFNDNKAEFDELIYIWRRLKQELNLTQPTEGE